MKKKISVAARFATAAVVAAAVAAAFVRCAKEDPAQAVNVTASVTPQNKATIKGKVTRSETNSQGSTDQSAIYSGASIKVSVDYSSLYSGSQASGSWSAIVTSDGSGKFSVDVPASESGVSVNFEIQPQAGNNYVSNQNSGSGSGSGGYTSKTGYWTRSSSSSSSSSESGVKSGSTIIMQNAVQATFTEY